MYVYMDVQGREESITLIPNQCFEALDLYPFMQCTYIYIYIYLKLFFIKSPELVVVLLIEISALVLCSYTSYSKDKEKILFLLMYLLNLRNKSLLYENSSLFSAAL